jgi:tetratricopeptide (TPR) repeat protein
LQASGATQTAVLAGHSVAFTGKLLSLPRAAARALVERLGGTAAAAVTAKTTMLVVGRGSGPGSAAESHASHKLRKAEQVNLQQPGRIKVLSEEEFCQLTGLHSPSALKQQFYAQRDVTVLYPRLCEDHLRQLQKHGILCPAVKTNSETYYAFSDLLVLRRVHAELERGSTFRQVVRSLTASGGGQMALDFRIGAQPARVVALGERAGRGKNARLLPAAVSLRESEDAEAAAEEYFSAGAQADDGSPAGRELAAASYRKALELSPALVPAIINLANLYYGRDELAEAQALYERAATLAPGYFEAHFNLGNIHHDLGRYPEAEQYYRRALSFNPVYPDAHLYLAVTLERMGRSAEARPYWRTYRDLAPDGEWADLAREFSD